MGEAMMIHPGLVLILTGFLAVMLPPRQRQAGMLAGSIAALICAALLPLGGTMRLPFAGDMELMVLRIDEVSFLFVMTFSILAVLGTLYGQFREKAGEAFACMAYAGSTVSMVLAGDWITLLLFWEMMAVSSMYLIYCGGQPDSKGAAVRYVIMHLFGGNLMLVGVIVLLAQGSTSLSALDMSQTAAFWLILLGVGVNGVIPPLHTWAADAYPQSSPTGGVFLSCLTTKAAVYVMLRLFAGESLLIWLGVWMAIFGAVYAIMENDARKLLSYHIISQLGFMAAGVGMGTALGMSGAAVHAVCNVFQKSLLFMCMGAVLYATGKRNITEMGGLAKKMPLTFLCFFAAAFAISGVPLFNGFVSKSLTVSAAAEMGLGSVELLLNLAGVGTFLSITLKMGYFIFLRQGTEQSREEKPLRPLRPEMKLAMMGGAGLCLVTGLFPGLLYDLLPYPIDYEPYTIDHLTQTLMLLGSAMAAFLMYLPHMKPSEGISLDVDWFYRRPLKKVIFGLSALLCRIQDFLGKGLVAGIQKWEPFLKNPVRKWLPSVDEADHESYDEDLYRLPISNPIGWIVVMLILLVSCLLLLIL